MRSVRVGERRVDVHGSMFAAYAHESLFGRGMGEDLDRAAENLPSLARVAYSMALAADRATGRQTPTLAAFQRGISQDPALLAALRAEFEAGCLVEARTPGPGAGGAGGGSPAAALLSLSLSRGVGPDALASARARDLVSALGGGGGGAQAARDATPADIMRLLG